MDIYCPKCGEPWDNDELHYVAEENDTTYKATLDEFQKIGCGVFDGQPCADPADRRRALVMSVGFEIMGDDVDGIAVMMEDAEAFGMFS
jgi:hypothetical protein